MKKKFILPFFIVLSTAFFSQDIIIDFTGTGASTNVETVEVVNLTNGTSIEVPGGSSLNLTTGTIVGIKNLGSFENQSIHAYPNPFANITNIEFYIGYTDNVKITITNINGQKVAEISKKLSAGVHSYKFKTGNLGMYFITISGNRFLQTSKVMNLGNSLQKSELVYQSNISVENFEKSNNKSTLKDFFFTVGDMLKLKGVSGDYATILTDVPTISTTYTFEFVECTDFDENNYSVLEIGNQMWTAENIKATNYSNGTAIPLVTSGVAWSALGDNNTDDAYCFYDNDVNSEYGALYTWAAAMGDNAVSSNSNPSGVQGVCPIGWHLPSDAEWIELVDYLGGENIAGGKLKATGTTYWSSPNTGASNESGFTAIPGGYRAYYTGNFYAINYNGMWWSTTEYDDTNAYYRALHYDSGSLLSNEYIYKSYGFSVRCLRD